MTEGSSCRKYNKKILHFVQNDEKKRMESINKKLMPLLIIVLVFALGYFYSKTTALEAQVKNGGVQGIQAQAQPTQAPQPTPDLSKAPAISDKDHITGSKNAPVTLVEYSDYECPFCKSFHPTVKKILDEYGDKVALVYRHYPLPFHQNAEKEAEASECINELGGSDAFWKYTDAIYERTTSNGTGFALDALGPLAGELGINQAAFQACLDSGKYVNSVKKDLTGGQKAGIQGTPGTIIIAKNGTRTLIPGALPFEQIKPMIETALK
jgi:protein-disulfide isomerase